MIEEREAGGGERGWSEERGRKGGAEERRGGSREGAEEGRREGGKKVEGGNRVIVQGEAT